MKKGENLVTESLSSYNRGTTHQLQIYHIET
jgi:hypothetical protein